MAFDPSTAKPAASGFDLSTATPVQQSDQEVQDRLRSEAAEGLQHAHDISAGRAPNPNVDAPGATERIGHGANKLWVGVKTLAQRAVGDSTDANQSVADNADAERNYQQGRGPNAGIDWLSLLGQGAAASPLMLIPGSQLGLTGGAGALAKMATAGAAQGGVQGGVEAVGEGKDAAGVATDAAKGAGAGAVINSALGMTGRGIVSYLKSKYPEALQSTAVQKILDRFKQDQDAGGVSAQDAIDMMNAAKAAKAPTTLADVGGENVKGLAGYLARAPGPSRQIVKQFLEDRDAQAGQRLSDLLDNTLSSGGAHESTKALLDLRSAAAHPAYQTAMDSSKVVDSPAIRQIMADPTVRQGIGAGIESQRLEALAAGEKFDPSVYVTEEASAAPGQAVKDTMAGLSNSKPMQVTALPNMRVLDAAKRGLDQQIEGERDAVTGRLSQRGVMLDRVRQKFVNELDQANPDYAAARAAWGGPSASMDAMRIGQNALREKPEVNADSFGKMTPNDQEFARVGLADSLRQKLMQAGVNADESKALLRSDWMKAQIKPFFKSNEDFNSFVDGVARERQMFDTKGDMSGGSQTAARNANDQANASDLAAASSGIAALGHAATGNLMSALKNVYASYKTLGMKPNPELNAQMARILFDPNVKLGDASQMLAKPDVPSVLPSAVDNRGIRGLAAASKEAVEGAGVGAATNDQSR
jgi:hypothetical protein